MAKEQGGFFSKLGQILGIGKDAEVEFEERRASPRLAFSVRVHLVREGARQHEARTRDISPIGMFLLTEALPPLGESVTMQFDGIGKDAEPISVVGVVARIEMGPEKGMGLYIDRKKTGPQAWSRFRDLVLHYRHHPPLMADQREGYFEARCQSCGWLGRVGQKSSRCPRCNKPVKPI